MLLFMHMTYTDNNGNQLFYEVTGNGNRSLVFIHGLCGDHRVWSKNVPYFSNDYKILTIDMFGHGESSSDISPKEAFEFLPSVLEELIKKESLKNVVVVGHSIAGNILLDCIQKKLANVKGYVFIDCALNASDRVLEARNKLVDSLLNNSDENLNAAIVDWYKTMMDMNAAPEDNELILSALKDLKGRWVLNFLKTTNFIRQVPTIDIPLLLFESDWLTKDQPERSFHKALPNADYSHWPVTNHFFFVYESAKFNERLREFLHKIG